MSTPKPVELSLFEQTDPELATSLRNVGEAMPDRGKRKPKETPEEVRHAAAVLGAHAHGRPIPEYAPITTPAQARAIAEAQLAQDGAVDIVIRPTCHGKTQEILAQIVDRNVTARAKMEDGMARAEAHADEAWKAYALETVKRLAKERAWFTADDVHGAMGFRPDIATHDLRALGPVLKQAKSRGWIESDGFEPSKRRNCAPMTKWKSRMWEIEG